MKKKKMPVVSKLDISKSVRMSLVTNNASPKKRKKKDNLKSLNRVKNHNWRKKRLLLKKTEIR